VTDDRARRIEEEAHRRKEDRFGKAGRQYGEREFHAREYEEGFDDGATWWAAQPVVVSAEQRYAACRVMRQEYERVYSRDPGSSSEWVPEVDAVLAALGITVEPTP